MGNITLKKYHGLGNDYLVFDPAKNGGLDLKPWQAAKLCHRNYGIGADGLMYGPVFTGRGIEVRIYNADGSEAEESGNGLRIFAKYLWEEGYVQTRRFAVFSPAGMVGIEMLPERGDFVRLDMGKPSYAGAQIPVAGLEGEVVNTHLKFHGKDYNTTCLSIGNPNCVIMLEEVTPKIAKELGPYVEGASYFPNRINMQICKVIDPENLAIETYERGTGYTLASGTGACAAAAAAKRMGLVGEKVSVHMQGGVLLVEIAEDGVIHMTGSVKEIGSFTLAEDFWDNRRSTWKDNR